MIDLRSDTVTRPTDAMRKAMASAPVGDDVFGEDPTINELQEFIADLFGKEAALYVPSGTMANQVSIAAHTQPGDEIICERGCHIFNYECGSPAMLSGVQLSPLDGIHGILTTEQVDEAIRSDDVHHAATKVVALENTHNRAGGVIQPLDSIKAISETARSRELKMHLDGARLMNAVVASGISAEEYGQYFDSMTLCFSKGLGAPVGSIVAGDGEFIQKAHKYRKAFGGGMRQAGIIAAGALYAMKNHVNRLQEDHANARRLAQGLSRIPGISIETEWVHTNIVIFTIDVPSMNASEFCRLLTKKDVHMLNISKSKVRAVTNLTVSGDDIDETLRQIDQLFQVEA